jgi:hypothetical protein
MKIRTINASGLIYNAPEKGYWEWRRNPGISSESIPHIDFAWRWYLNLPDTNRLL